MILSQSYTVMKEFQQKYMQGKGYYHLVTIKEKIKIVMFVYFKWFLKDK